MIRAVELFDKYWISPIFRAFIAGNVGERISGAAPSLRNVQAAYRFQ